MSFTFNNLLSFSFFLQTVSKPSSLELPLVPSFNLYQISLGVLILDQACKMCFKFSNNFNYTLIMCQWGFLSALIAAQVGRAWLLYACAAFTAVWLHKSFAAPCATNSITLMWKTSFHVFVSSKTKVTFPNFEQLHVHNHVNGDASLNTAVTCQSLNKMKLLKCQQSY